MSTHAIHTTAALAAAPADHHRDGRPVPRWATIAAHLAVLAALPSSLWRVPLALGLPIGPLEDGAQMHVDGWEIAYVLGLSMVLESLALLTLGLIRPWGERAPRWIPLLGGRRLRPLAVVVPAALGAIALTAIWMSLVVRFFTQDPQFAHDAHEALLVACYLPLLAWGPLLGAVTFAYWRRRARD